MIAVENQLNAQMVVLARESRGLTQKELADKIGISTTLMCQVEQNNRSLAGDAMTKMRKALRYPEEFFYQEGDGHLPASLHYRKREHVAAKFLMPLEAQINIYRLNVEILAQRIKFPPVNVPALDLGKYETFEKVAKELRKQWKLPKGPVENLAELLEVNGIIVISFDFGTERVDSRTVFTKDRQPIIVINKAMLGDRQRFSLAYELGHLVMHTHEVPSFERDISHEANMFAAGFLMPETEIRKDFEKGITIALLGDLKRKWKVSMIALLYRAADLGFLTDNQKRYLLAQFNTLKIRRREPPELDVAKEQPRLFRDLLTKYKNAHKYSVKEMAAMMHLEQEDFLSRYTE